MNTNELREKVESIIHAHATNNFNAPEGDWAERRRLRRTAVEEIMSLLSLALAKRDEEEFICITHMMQYGDRMYLGVDLKDIEEGDEFRLIKVLRLLSKDN